MLILSKTVCPVEPTLALLRRSEEANSVCENLYADQMHFPPSIILGDCSPSQPLALLLFNFIRVPNFGASPSESLGQSRDHTLLPKRPRMPAKGFIDGDWTTDWKEGWGLDRVKGKAAMATPELEVWFFLWKVFSYFMMAFAPPKSIDGPKMQTKMSTWTPLNHQLLNDRLFKTMNLIANLGNEDLLQTREYKILSLTEDLTNSMSQIIFLARVEQEPYLSLCLCVFEERRALLGKWFDKWTDSQRRRILTGLLERCSLAQQKFCCRKLQEKIPAEALDFTTKLPRVLSLYIFSFLDPRSLCRCAQVSWHWKNLTELDQLWMLKCLRFNWYINFSPTPFEQGIWKKHYIQMVKELHVTKPKTPPKDRFAVADIQPVTSSSPEEKQFPASAFRSSSSLRKKTQGEKELPPWRSSDKHPTDIIRFNYLDNCDPIVQIWQGRRKRHEMNPDFSRQSHDKKNKLQDRSKLRKAQSLRYP
ncbi:F-box only protein 16 isoform X1 [Prionailurus iriomotensis]